jgi:hypothetical protein
MFSFNNKSTLCCDQNQQKAISWLELTLACDDFLDESVLVLSAEVRLGMVWTLGLEPVIESTVTAVLVVVVVVIFWLGLGTLCIVAVGLMFSICVIFGTAFIP